MRRVDTQHVKIKPRVGPLQEHDMPNARLQYHSGLGRLNADSDTGLAFIPTTFGTIVSTATQRLFVRSIRDSSTLSVGEAAPEARLFVGMVGAMLVSIDLLGSGTANFTTIPRIVPRIGAFILGLDMWAPCPRSSMHHCTGSIRVYPRLWTPRLDVPEIRRFGHGRKYIVTMYLSSGSPSLRTSTLYLLLSTLVKPVGRLRCTRSLDRKRLPGSWSQRVV